jgi:ribosomal subunit interface protein
MKIPFQLTFRDMEHSDAVEADVRKRVEKLDKYFPEIIMGCRVVVECHHQQHHQGNLFHTRIDLTVPGDELVVSREQNENHAHESMHVSIRDAFDAATRQLKTYTDKLRHKTKRHATPLHGQIVSLKPDEDFGRIVTDEGREIYFHRHSVINQDFDQLDVGQEVRFDEETGDSGPQASTVKVVGKHHIPQQRP